MSAENEFERQLDHSGQLTIGENIMSAYTMSNL